MRAIFWKEFQGFFQTLIGYVILIIFLISIGLLVWVFPQTSVLNYGYADLSVLFNVSPYVYLFLIPAITMRSFAEEFKSGTIELLFTKPLSNWQIILGKYLACCCLVLFSLLPTSMYYFSIVQLGNPVGNIDSAGVLGSYIGLFFLGTAFTAIGIWASSLSSNQIIAFIFSLFVCFFCYYGIDAISQIPIFDQQATVIEQFGIMYHYLGMSKGLIDSRDIVYFIGISLLFLQLTRWNLSKHA